MCMYMCVCVCLHVCVCVYVSVCACVRMHASTHQLRLVRMRELVDNHSRLVLCDVQLQLSANALAELCDGDMAVQLGAVVILCCIIKEGLNGRSWKGTQTLQCPNWSSS